MSKNKKEQKVTILQTAEYKQLRNDYVRLSIYAKDLARMAKVQLPEKKPLFMSKDDWSRIQHIRKMADAVLLEQSNVIEYEELNSTYNDADTQTNP